MRPAYSVGCKVVEMSQISRVNTEAKCVDKDHHLVIEQKAILRPEEGTETSHTPE